MKLIINALIAQIIAKFAELNGTSLVGIRRYEAKGSGEICNHVVNANWSYGEAKKRDMKKLAKATMEDVKAIAEKANVAIEVVQEALAEMQTTNKKRSEGQKNAYIPVTNAIKYCKESGMLHIYAQAIWKGVPEVEGTYKEVKSRPKTIAKNVAKKHFDLATRKFRQFIVHPDMLAEVAIDKEVIGLK
jgi:hypothetical protein